MKVDLTYVAKIFRAMEEQLWFGDILALSPGGVSVPPRCPLWGLGPHEAPQLSRKRLNTSLLLTHGLNKYPGLGPDEGPGAGFDFSDSMGNGTAILASWR